MAFAADDVFLLLYSIFSLEALYKGRYSLHKHRFYLNAFDHNKAMNFESAEKNGIDR